MSRQWDSNAETVRPRRFGSRIREGDDEDEDNVRSNSGEGNSSVLGQVIHRLWIFKALRPYGWLLPGFFINMLLTNGPKAFLQTIAVLFGVSAISLLFEKLWATINGGAKRNNRVRRRKMQYKSRVSRGTDSSASKGDDPAFGGWED